MILQRNFAEREHFFAVRVLFCSIYVLFPRVLHEYGRITTVHERHVTEEVFMYSLLSNYVYIHRELWHHSKSRFSFRHLKSSHRCSPAFSGFCFLPEFSFFWNRAAALPGLRLERWFSFSFMPSFSSAMHFCSHGTPGSIPNSGPAFYAPSAPPFHADGLRRSDRAVDAATR